MFILIYSLSRGEINKHGRGKEVRKEGTAAFGEGNKERFQQRLFAFFARCTY